MIVSKHGTSYDTSDGSEQPHAASALSPAARADAFRTEDHGATAYPRPASPATAAAGAAPALAPKPAWSVLSAAGLAEALRLEARADDPARLRQEEERAERRRAAGEVSARRKSDSAAQTEGERYRNAWEHT